MVRQTQLSPWGLRRKQMHQQLAIHKAARVSGAQEETSRGLLRLKGVTRMEQGSWGPASLQTFKEGGQEAS